MTIVVCPKCGTENPSDEMNCTGCRVNLRFALEHSDLHEMPFAREHPEAFGPTKAKVAPRSTETAGSATDTCWYCQKRQGVAEASAVVPMTLVIGTQFHVQTKEVKYRAQRITVPRCASCKAGHEQMRRNWALVAIACLLSIVPSCVVILAVPGLKTSPGGTIGVMLGFLALGLGVGFGIYAKRKRARGILHSERDIRGFRPAKELIEQGWRIGTIDDQPAAFPI